MSVPTSYCVQAYCVQARDLRELLAQSAGGGDGSAQLLQDLGLNTDLLDKPDALIDMEDAWRIIAAHQNAVGEETHLYSRRPLQRGSTRLVFSSLQHCASLEQGLQALADNYNIIHGGQFNVVRRHGATLSYVVDDEHFHYRTQPNPFALEFALLKIHCALSVLIGHPLKLQRMATRRKRVPEHHHHLLLFDTHIKVGQAHYELAYDGDQAGLRLANSDGIDIAGNLYAHYLSLLRPRQPLDDDHFVRRVLMLIRDDSARGLHSKQELVAAKLSISVATLRRRLAARSLSFRSLLDEVYKEQAVNLLHERHSLLSIAERLGYSDERSFKRAFKRWYGVSPAAYRNDHQLH